MLVVSGGMLSIGVSSSVPSLMLLVSVGVVSAGGSSFSVADSLVAAVSSWMYS